MGIEGYYEDYFDERQEKEKLTNFQKIKNMSVAKMARFLEDKVTLPFEIAISNKRSRLNYIKQWLQEESEE